jgi:hypothetical protein
MSEFKRLSISVFEYARLYGTSYPEAEQRFANMAAFPPRERLTRPPPPPITREQRQSFRREFHRESIRRYSRTAHHAEYARNLNLVGADEACHAGRLAGQYGTTYEQMLDLLRRYPISE